MKNVNLMLIVAICLFQILKLYAWEMTFKNKIIDKRKIELQKLLNLKILERILETSFHISPFLVSFLFNSYVIFFYIFAFQIIFKTLLRIALNEELYYTALVC